MQLSSTRVFNSDFREGGGTVPPTMHVGGGGTQGGNITKPLYTSVHLNFLEKVQLYDVYTAQLDCINNLFPLGWTSVPTDPGEDS